jgi:NADH-quinone oxidoreductase subunit N
MTFLALELLSIPSYILTGFQFDRRATEGSLKYFVFGSIASAMMLYGMSLLYGITGTLLFSADFVPGQQSTLFIIGALFTLSGFFYKIAAAPFHPWAPDVYEASPMPVVAYFSIVPKLAGLAVLSRVYSLLQPSTLVDWQFILVAVSFISLAIGVMAAKSKADDGVLIHCAVWLYAGGDRYLPGVGFTKFAVLCNRFRRS